MAIRDLFHNAKPQMSLAPAARTATATGTAVDLRGFDSAMVVVSFGTYTDGTHTPSLQHSVDGSTFTTVGTADLIGSLTAVSSTAGSNTVQKVGYIGEQRYLRVVMTVASATTGALSAAQIIAGNPHQAPVT